MSKRRKSDIDPAFLREFGTRRAFRDGNTYVKTVSRRYLPKVESNEQYIGQKPYEPWFEEHISDVDEPSRDWRQDFAPRLVVDLRHQCKKVVAAINGSRGMQAFQRARRAYIAGFEDLNLCGRCKLPIRVQKSSKNAIVETVTHLRPVGASKAGIVRPYSVPRIERKEKLITYYADIQAHYRWFWTDSTKTKATYRLIDGTGRNIQVRSEPYQLKRKATRQDKYRGRGIDADGNVLVTRQREFLVEVLEDGSEVRGIVPESTFRVWNAKCDCKYHRSKVEYIQRY